MFGNVIEIHKSADIIYLPNLVRRATCIQLQSPWLQFACFNVYLASILIFNISLSTVYVQCLCITQSVFICGFVSLLDLWNVWESIATVSSHVFLRSNYRGRPGREDGHHVLTYSLEIITDEMLPAFSHHICADSVFKLWLARLLSRKIQMVIRESTVKRISISMFHRINQKPRYAECVHTSRRDLLYMLRQSHIDLCRYL